MFLYDDADRAELLRVFGRFAATPDLSFTWYDAATLSDFVRRQAADALRSLRFRRRFGMDTPTVEL